MSYVNIRASYNGKFLCAEGGGGGDLVANRGDANEWELFFLMRLGNGAIALQTYDGHFVVAEGGGGGEVKADRTEIGEWERFSMVTHSDGRVSFIASNGQYVCAERGGNMVANRDAADEWEKFTLEPATRRNWVKVAQESLMSGSIEIHFTGDVPAELSWNRYSVFPPWHTGGTHRTRDDQGNPVPFIARFVCDPYCDVWFALNDGIGYHQVRVDAYGNYTINPCTI